MDLHIHQVVGVGLEIRKKSNVILCAIFFRKFNYIYYLIPEFLTIFPDHVQNSPYSSQVYQS